MVKNVLCWWPGPLVVGVTYQGDHVLTVRFDDGFERTIDFEPILHGPLFVLRDPGLVPVGQG